MAPFTGCSIRVISSSFGRLKGFACSSSIQFAINGRRHILSAAANRRLDVMMERHREIMDEMQQASSGSAFTLAKELASLAKVVALQEKRNALESSEGSLRELLEEASQAGDSDLELECREEIEEVLETRKKIEKRLLIAILPKDDDDFQCDAVLEIRAGTGGDEAAMFSSELLESYKKTIKAMKWKLEIMSETRTDLGGIREAAISVVRQGGRSSASDDGDDDDDFKSQLGPFGFFKFESGVHRVQRVPINDSRIQTSACSVAALPLLQDSGSADELLPMSEVRVDTMRSSGAGGQSVNTTDSAVRVTHIPTGITASIQEGRSQHQNKDIALKLIAARVRDLQKREAQQARDATRSSLMGSGDRSERIRTYNYPQDRVTDHRCKHTVNGIAKLLNGGADDGLVVTFYPVLRDMHRDELMKALEGSNE